MQIPEFLTPLTKYFVDEIPLLKTSKTIQVIVIRQTHDFTIFRTEETRELNIVTLPASINNPNPVLKVVMLASKQKAPENRNYITLFRTFAEKEGIEIDDKVKSCRLKDDLCRECPRCVLFGAVSTEGGRGQDRWNIKHRVEYSSAYSVEPYERISELITFNAVDPITQSTGQALGYTENVRPIANFPSVVTLNSVTWHEFIWYLKTLLATKSYGAETRIKGDTVNYVIGIVAGFEEIITPLELNLELSESWSENLPKVIYEILRKYANEASSVDVVKILAPDEVNEIVEGVKNFKPNRDFLEEFITLTRSFSERASQSVR